MEQDPQKNVPAGSAPKPVPGSSRLPPRPPTMVGTVLGEPRGGGRIPPSVVPPVAQALPYEPRKPHFFTIYKRGLGYATRMGTMAGVALLAAVTAEFLINYLPVWGFPVRDAQTGASHALRFYLVVGG